MARSAEGGNCKVTETQLGSLDESPRESVKSNKDACHLAYAVKKGIKWVVVVDGRPGAEYADIGKGTLAFSPDGKRIAYAAK